MKIADFLAADDIFPDLMAGTKTEMLRLLSAHAAKSTAIAAQEIFAVLTEREKLSSTAIGSGVAIPHGRFGGIHRVHGFFARLDEPLDYEAPDGRKVDLVFMLMAPISATADHLRALALVSRLLRDKTVCPQLRDAVTAEVLYALFTESEEA